MFMNNVKYIIKENVLIKLVLCIDTILLYIDKN